MFERMRIDIKLHTSDIVSEDRGCLFAKWEDVPLLSLGEQRNDFWIPYLESNLNGLSVEYKVTSGPMYQHQPVANSST